MVAFLVSRGEQTLIGRNHVILQLSHSLELHTRHCVECAARFAQSVLGRAFKGLTIFIEVGAEHRERRDLGKWIEKRRAETRQNIEIAAASLDEWEEARAVDALATSEDCIEIGSVVDYEV